MRPGEQRSGSVLGWLDAVVGAVLFAGTVLFLRSLPIRLSGADEPHALYEATRILDGDVPYRDFFELTTPGWLYLMAALFSLFGATLATARTAVALIHAANVLLVYLESRRLGVRRVLACATGPVYLVVCEAAYPVANYHWLSTLLCLVLLGLCIDPLHGRLRQFATGVVVGCLIALHQGRGLTMGVGVGAFLVIATVLQRLGSAPGSRPMLMPALAALVGGILLVVLPMLAVLLMQGGFQPLWRALVLQPLVNYRQALHCPWGFIGPNAAVATSTFPALLKYLPPLLVGLSLVRLVLQVSHERNSPRTETLALLTVFGSFSALSIRYYPDFIHIAFIAPVFLIMLAETLEWALGRLPARVQVPLAWTVALAAVMSSGLLLERRWTFLRSRRTTPYVTAFGRVDLLPNEVRLYETLSNLLREVPGRRLYCYPRSGYTHLLLGARNPTRFEFIFANSYSSAEQVQEVLDSLIEQDLPYIVADPAFIGPQDPIGRFIQAHYEPLSGADPAAESIWKRKLGAVDRQP